MKLKKFLPCLSKNEFPSKKMNNSNQPTRRSSLYVNLLDDTNKNFKVIVLTGGPCGGKTSSLTILSDLFESIGWKVFRVPETAATLLSGGVLFSELTPKMAYSFQKDLLTVLLKMEDTYINLARLSAENGKKAVVICDRYFLLLFICVYRGAMDPSAYISRDEWLQSLKELGLNETELRDKRYDCVVHLVTAGIELAMELDQKVMNAWNGHPSFQVIDNLSSKNFNEKCDRVVQSILSRLGMTDHIEEGKKKDIIKRKFLIKNFSWEKEFPCPYRDFSVEHCYLQNFDQSKNDGIQVRIRKRQEVGGVPSYNMTIRHASVENQRVETRKHLMLEQYEILKLQIDQSRQAVLKKRRCFLFKGNYFQIDLFESAKPGLLLLEAYLDSTVKNDFLPDWVEIQEVTNDKQYSMFELSKK